jgi:hypothetical protein
MNRLLKFTLRIDEAEREMIASIANKFHRTQSDAIRFLIRVTFFEFFPTPDTRTTDELRSQNGSEPKINS